MKEPRARVLVVDDYEPWRRFVSSTLKQHPEFLIVCEVADGLPAVEKTRELQPDLILLDIGLPTLNGIEAARRIRELAANSKILFISENRSWDIAKEAFRSGGDGYLVKSDAASELLPAMRAVLQGKRFVSASLAGYDLTSPADGHTADRLRQKKVIQPESLQNVAMVPRHEIGFYSDERWLLDRLTEFIGTTLAAGNAAVVAATDSHLKSLVPRLQAYSLDIGAAIEQGRYITLDAADTLATFMVDGILVPARFMDAFGDVIHKAAKASRGKHSRVKVFGEYVHILCEQGNVEAAIQMEKLGNQLINSYNVDIFCGCSLACVPGGMHGPAFKQMCAEHSAVYSY